MSLLVLDNIRMNVLLKDDFNKYAKYLLTIVNSFDND